ncbi:MAG: class I SAM-dependent methyltransferase [Methylacidiphilaceae bacterium]|nr:class I SAM-dependent methyltransferase [Candidatus Methylacidiphilaceae bacterium]
MAFELLNHPIVFSRPERWSRVTAWHLHIPFAFLLVDLLRPKRVVELGVHSGDSYCAFCQAIVEIGLSSECFGIDHWRGDGQAGGYGSQVLEDLRRHHDPRYGSFSQLLPILFEEALPRFKERSLDLLHIDGLHTYEAVRRDFQSWLPRMSEQGVILLHDVEVRREGFGVWKLWEEVSKLYPARLLRNCFGLGVVAVGERVEPAVQELLELPEKQWQALEGLWEVLGQANERRCGTSGESDGGLPSWALRLFRRRAG